MKFLVALGLLFTVNAFAEIEGSRFKCYENPNRRSVVYTFDTSDKVLRLTFPRRLANLNLEFKDMGSCLEAGLYCDDVEGECDEQIFFSLCSTGDPRVNGLIPLNGGRVYCDPKINNFF